MPVSTHQTIVTIKFATSIGHVLEITMRYLQIGILWLTFLHVIFANDLYFRFLPFNTYTFPCMMISNWSGGIHCHDIAIINIMVYPIPIKSHLGTICFDFTRLQRLPTEIEMMRVNCDPEGNLDKGRCEEKGCIWDTSPPRGVPTCYINR